MPILAVIDATGLCTNTIVATAETVDATHIDITSVTPRPGPRWTYDGTTWTAPPPPPPSARQLAQAEVAGVAATLPDAIAQAQADASTIAAMTPGSPPTADQIAALARHATGWVALLDALGTLATATGVVP